MTARSCDMAILGGGLAGGVIALALARHRPELSVLLIEQDATLGGNHVWSFFGSDLEPAARELLEPAIEASWQAYDVRFPGHSRTLETSYHSMTSARFDAAVRAALPADAVLTGVEVIACSANEVTLADQTRIAARGVIDARGLRSLTPLTGGWQKFVGRRLKLARPHGLERPVVMDATVEQIDGYRFVYVLPFAQDELFIEDTYYSESPVLDIAAIGARVDAYAAAHGWTVASVEGEEHGVLPVVSGGDFDTFWRAGAGHGEATGRAGVRAGLFHAVTGYSLPDALRYAFALARLDDLGAETLTAFSHDWAKRHWQAGTYLRSLSALLFGAAEPAKQYRMLERFYRLSPALIERFYAGRLTLADKLRVLAGRPPVPMHRAIAVLGGFGPTPIPLDQSGKHTR